MPCGWEGGVSSAEQLHFTAVGIAAAGLWCVRLALVLSAAHDEEIPCSTSSAVCPPLRSGASPEVRSTDQGEDTIPRNVSNKRILVTRTKEFYNQTPSHDTGHGTGAHWH